MILRRGIQRDWLTLAVAIALDVALGFLLYKNGNVEAWIWKVGLLAASVVPLVFTAWYTWLGWHSAPEPGSGRTHGAMWWENILSSALVWAALSVIPVTGPLAVALWVYNGRLAPGWLAWCEVSGAPLTALAWLRLCIVTWVVYSSPPPAD